MTVQKEFLHLFNIIATPSEVFQDLNETPRWRFPLIFLIVSSVAVGWFMVPAIMEPMRRMFSSTFGEGGAEAAMKSVTKSVLVLGLVIDPLLKVVRWFVLACTLYLLSIGLIKDHPHLFKRLFSVVAYTETIFILMSILTILIVYAKGLVNIENSEDLTIFKGLDYFLKDKNANPSLASVLANINPFSLWYIATITIGLSIMTRLKRFEALGVASVSWLIWMIMGILQSKAADQLVTFIM